MRMRRKQWVRTKQLFLAIGSFVKIFVGCYQILSFRLHLASAAQLKTKQLASTTDGEFDAVGGREVFPAKHQEVFR